VLPTFTTYNIEVISSGKPFDVTVIDSNNLKEVVAVRTTSQTTSIQQSTTIKIDQNGNQITETNNITAIKEDQPAQTSIQTIISATPYLQLYDVKYVETIDYGTAKQISITFESTDTSQQVQTVTFFN
jgi:hypothetical protein